MQKPISSGNLIVSLNRFQKITSRLMIFSDIMIAAQSSYYGFEPWRGTRHLVHYTNAALWYNTAIFNAERSKLLWLNGRRITIAGGCIYG